MSLRSRKADTRKAVYCVVQVEMEQKYTPAYYYVFVFQSGKVRTTYSTAN